MRGQWRNFCIWRVKCFILLFNFVKKNSFFFSSVIYKICNKSKNMAKIALIKLHHFAHLTKVVSPIILEFLIVPPTPTLYNYICRYLMTVYDFKVVTILKMDDTRKLLKRIIKLHSWYRIIDTRLFNYFRQTDFMGLNPKAPLFSLRQK